MLSIEVAAKELKLAYTKTHFQERLTQANHRNLTFEETLTELLNAEVEDRRNRSCERSIKQAKFHQKIYLMDFDDLVFKNKVRQQLRELKALQFIEAKENGILIGNPGTGKTHFSIGIGIEACLKGYQVIFVNTPNLVIQIKEAVSQSQFMRFKRRVERGVLMIIDELGYLSFDEAGAELLFNLLSNRNDQGSLLITTNLTFERWQECIKDPTLIGALVGRLAYQAHVVDMQDDSYRIKQTSEWMNRLIN